MNVKELIEQLQRMPQDAEVKFAYNYGDYWRTQVAADVTRCDTGEVTYSEYHQMDKIVEYDAERELDRYARCQNRTVVILE